MQKSWSTLVLEWLVWRLYGDSVENDTFLWRLNGKTSLEIVWGFYGENMVKQISCSVNTFLHF